MNHDDDDDLGKKRRLPPTSAHQLAAEEQAQRHLEEMYKRAVDRAARAPFQDSRGDPQAAQPDARSEHARHRAQSEHNANLPSQHHHPDYRELQRSHARIADDEAQRSRQSQVQAEPARPRSLTPSNASDGARTAPDRAARTDQGEVARRQDQQQKSAERQEILREQGRDAPAEKAREAKVEKAEGQQRRARWGDEFRTTPEERETVENARANQQSRSFGRTR